MYHSEEEQLDAIKKWWHENGIAVIVGLVIGLGGLFGWQAWQKHVDSRAENASARYSQLLNTLDQGNAESAGAVVDSILEDYAVTPYAPLAALAAAKAAVSAEDAEAAAARLQWVVDNAGQTEFVPLARLRLARLRLAGGELDEAERLLEAKGYPDAYTARRSELRGDLYAKRGETAGARAAYDNALKADLPAQNRQMIQIKRDALPPVRPAAGETPADA